MKKSLILVGMLTVGYVNAQEGNVGINTEVPKATLEVLPSAKNLEGTTNEGIVAPKLTKARIANIAEANLVEGTLVYVTDNTYTGANTKVSKITEKGYYFYNGTEWVKAGTNGELWAQRNNGGVTETYLKPADADGNKYQYSNKGILSNLGKVTREDSRWVVSGNYGYTEGEIPNARLTSSDVLPLNSTMGNQTNLNVFNFGKNLGIVREAHAGQGVMAGKKSYVGQRSDIGAIDVTSNIASIGAMSGTAYAFTNTNTVGSIIAVDGEAIAGSDTHRSLTATDVAGGSFSGRNFANTTNLVGVKSVTHNYGNATSIIGGRFDASSTNNHTVLGIENPTVTVTTLRGIQTAAGNRPNSTTTNVAGAFISSNLMENSKATNTMTVDARGYIQTGSTVENLSNIYSYVRGFGAANVTNLYGFRFDTLFHRDFNAENMYGLYLANINQGTTLNYAIYSNDGKVRLGDLKGTDDRVVYADKDGVLKTGSSADAVAGKIASTDAMQCNAENRGKMNFIPNDEGSDVFGICLRNKDGNYYWGYMVGGNNPTNGTGAFGSGL